MATYAIGDIQGCYDELLQLLTLINFADTDTLWFVGDLVNRGPESLQVLRFIKQLPNKIVVLGNHDFHLLALYCARFTCNAMCGNASHTMQDILQAPDVDELLTWLRMQLLLFHDEQSGFVMTHAGIYPWWDLATAKRLAIEVEQVLHGAEFCALITHIYGDQPDIWSEDLQGQARWRFIINAFVRMRFCNKYGHLDFTATGKPNTAPKGYLPWFQIPASRARNLKIIFGHWAALEGKTGIDDIYALDTGCVWGKALTALCLDTRKVFQVKAKVCYT